MNFSDPDWRRRFKAHFDRYVAAWSHREAAEAIAKNPAARETIEKMRDEFGLTLSNGLFVLESPR